MTAEVPQTVDNSPLLALASPTANRNRETVRYSHTGAPTLYREEYAQMLVDYFESAILPGEPAPHEAGEGSGKRALDRIYTTLPTFERFARMIGVSTRVLADWDKRHPAFLQARARAKDIQAEHFSIGLVSGAMNPTGAIFAAKNLIGWSDKQTIETTVRTEDSDSTGQLKQALAHATPDQLAAFGQLVQAMLANAPAVTAGDVAAADRTSSER